jgi:predicted secreted acid phosphatase
MKGTMKAVVQAFFSLILITFVSFPSFSEPNNLDLSKNELKQYHDSGLYEKELEQVLYQAQDYILKQVKINQNLIHPKKLAIVLDIDETSLSNYSRMLNRNFVGEAKQIHRDILAADAPAISPTLQLYKKAMKEGVSIFFVTGRHLSELQATRLNLVRAGFKNWAGLYLRPDTYKDSSIVSFKAKTRESISKQGYIVVATIGDQDSDLKGGYALKGFKLPNPFYHLP